MNVGGETKQNITCTYRKPINHLMHLTALRILWLGQRARDEILKKWNGDAIIHSRKNCCTRKEKLSRYTLTVVQL